MSLHNPTRPLTLVALILLLVAGSATAGLYVEQRITSSGDGQGMEMTVRAWADGDFVRVEYVESNNPILSGGSYLLTTDGGQTVFLIRPEDKTYSMWDMAEVFALIGNLAQATAGMVRIDFRDPFSETLSDEPGGTVLGYSTQQRSWRSGFTMDMKISFMDQSNRMETLTNAWMTDEIDTDALSIWFGAQLPTTGDPELDAVLTAGLDNVDGLVLKMEQQTTTTNKKGKQSSSSTVMEVTEIREETPDSALFVMPEDYTEAPLLPLDQAGAAEGDDAANPLKGLFGRKKKKNG